MTRKDLEVVKVLVTNWTCTQTKEDGNMVEVTRKTEEVRVSDAARFLRTNAWTLRRLEARSGVRASRTPAGHRVYGAGDLAIFAALLGRTTTEVAA
jgi:molybdenum cofactor biosynthesis enzyme